MGSSTPFPTTPSAALSVEKSGGELQWIIHRLTGNSTTAPAVSATTARGLTMYAAVSAIPLTGELHR